MRSDVRLPAERFYWSILRTESIGGPRSRVDERLGFLFESDLPVPIEGVHAVYQPLGDGRTLACGMPTDEIRSLAAPNVLSLRPGSIPETIAGDTPNASLNLLVGAFEPARVQRARARFVTVFAASLVLIAGVLAVGLERRAAHHRSEAAMLAEATAAVYASVLPAETGTIPHAARLTAELRLLARTRPGRAAPAERPDAPTQLAAVLASWPSGLHATTHSIGVGPTVITVHTVLPDEAAAERFVRELTPPSGWRVAQPTVQRGRTGIDVRVRIEPETSP